MTINNLRLITPQWPVPSSIKSLVTTRVNGFSQPPFTSFNLASHIHDSPKNVSLNRDKLEQLLPSQSLWLNQVHSLEIVAYDKLIQANHDGRSIAADGIFSQKKNQVCSILTADCLPILFCSKNGKIVAAIHAGWRGLAKGIIDQTIQKLCQKSDLTPNDFLTWLGPAISKKYFEVGSEVRQAFIHKNADYDAAFILHKNNASISKQNKYMADIYQLASINLQHRGITEIYGGNFCTYDDKDNFFSYRRDTTTGRMATLIWITE